MSLITNAIYISDQEANKLIEDNYNLVYFFTNRLCKNPSLYDDCFQEGCIGLIEAARKYNPNNEQGAAFGTYASREIQYKIKDMIYRNRPIRLPDEQRSKINNYYSKKRELEQETQVEISSSMLYETALEFGITSEVFNLIDNPIASLDYAIDSDDNSQTSFSDTFVDDSISIEDLVIGNISFNDIVNVVESFIKKVKSSNPEYVEIFCEHLADIIKSAGCGYNSVKSRVDARHPNLIGYPKGTKEYAKWQSIYTGTSEFVKRNMSKLCKILVSKNLSRAAV